MKFYESGNETGPVILLLPDTCCHWRTNFGTVSPLLKQDFREVCISYDGFDETEQTVFTDMLTEMAKIEEYIHTNKLWRAYLRRLPCPLTGWAACFTALRL